MFAWALLAVSMDDISFILLDSRGSVHAFRAVWKRLLSFLRNTVEPLEVSVLSLGRVLSAPIPWRLQAWFRDMAQNSVL